MLRTLRREGDSLVMAIPEKFVEQNKLCEGSRVRLMVSGSKMIVSLPQRPRYVLADLMAEMPDILPMVDGWEC